jgi:class 3 adenylate cyclase
VSDRILVIDDDPDYRSLLRQYVTLMGYEVRVAESGEQGLEIFFEWRPDLVITDIHMSGITGLMVLKKIKEYADAIDVPVIVISSDGSEEMLVVALSTGASEFMAKPIRVAELTPKIQKEIELKKYKQKLIELTEKLHREKLGLSKFFSDDLAHKIISEEILPQLGGSQLEASIMFFDIRGSTSLGETLEPGIFAEFLSTIFTDTMDLVFQHRGSVNKLLGDGMLATFGCPVPTEEDALNCVRCALDIRRYLARFNEARPEYLAEPVRAGIGIATGQVFAGNVGSARRLEYTVIGDSVNLAARLQSLNKRLGSDILIDGATRAKLGDGIGAGNRIRARVRGKANDVLIYRLNSMRANL